MPLELHAGTDGLGRAQQRLLVLQQLTAALARARTYTSIASVIIDEAMPALNAEVGVVALVSEDRRTLRNVGFKGVDTATEAAWQAYPVESPVPVAEAALCGKPIIVHTLEERNARYPVLAQVHGLEHGGPVATFPLFVDERLLGVLGFCWDGPVVLDADDLSFLKTLAEQCGLAIERARLYEVAEHEIEVRKASEGQLREANARKDEFLAMLAHELRNPLAPIKSAADLLATMELDASLVRIQRVIARQADHMKRIVDDLLDVSRITRERLPLELETVDLTALVGTTVSDHASSFAAAGIELSMHLGEAPLWVRADVTRLSQAFANLLHNAQKFTPRGKQVTITVARDRSNADRATVEVRDEGSGIDADLLPHLFEPFSQAERSLARTGGGLGLGLALVRGLVHLHGGEVSVYSDGRGRGATFTVTVPVISVAGGPCVEAPTAHVAPVRVLIVEDNPDAAEMLGALVETLGNDVRIAHAATEAFTILGAWDAQVILSDLGLPDIDGYSFARMIRERADTPAPLLVAVSGYGNPSDKARARDAGFDLHVTKPVDAATIVQVLDTRTTSGQP